MIERKRLTVTPKPTKEQRLANFKGKRGARSRKGIPNKVTVTLKNAILLAAEAEGEDGNGKDGLTGYLRSIARDMPKTFTLLLAKLVPLDIQHKLMQLQMQITANAQIEGRFAGGAGIDVKVIRGMPTGELKAGLAALEKLMQAPRQLQRLDTLDELDVEEAQVIDQLQAPDEYIVPTSDTGGV